MRGIGQGGSVKSTGLFQSLLLLVALSAGGCVTIVTGESPECPNWTDKAITEYETAQGYADLGLDEDQDPLFPNLEKQIGEIARVCDAIAASNGKVGGCDPETWGGWASIILSMDCD